MSAAFTSRSGHEALLASAIVNVSDYHGKLHTCRAILDSGSTSNFMTAKLCHKLNLRTDKHSISIDGIGGTCTQGTHYTSSTIRSRFNGYSAKLNFIVMDKVTGSLPTLSMSDRSWEVPAHLKLADPNYCLGGEVNMVIGIGLFWDLLCVGQIKLGRGLPVLQKTKFGWIVAGDLTNVSENHRGICNFGLSNLEDQMEKFWRLEESRAHYSAMSSEESLCEELYNKSVSVSEDGRFVVCLPVRSQSADLGDSFCGAYRRLESMERRFKRDPQLRGSYVAFMREYQNLGHMTAVVDDSLQESENRYYLPQHAVLRPDSTTTKLRVVFDASAKGTAGTSLNDQLLVGSKVQEDLLSLILRFRCHRIVVTADIEKMYRQVWVHPDQRKLQCNLWRENPDEQPTTFQLNTITYGTAPAPFLATRCLRKIADDLKTSNPSASQVIAHDFYVDDMITGSKSSREALTLCGEVSAALESRGFKLRRWCSNNQQVPARINY